MKVLRIIALTALCFVLLSGQVRAAPNILVVMVDDMASSVYDAAAALNLVPNIEALRARSHEFSNHISTTPLCCPSRVNFLTGQLAQTNGVWNNNLGRVMDTSGSLAALLQNGGFETAIVGKYLNRMGDESTPDPFHQRTYVAPGWNHWQVIVASTTRQYGFELNENGEIFRYDNDYQTDLVSNRSVGLIGQLSEPFFILVAPTAVHGESGIESLKCEFATRVDWKIRPAPRHEDTPFVPAPRPPSFNENNLSDKPWEAQYPRLTREERDCIDELFSTRVSALRAVDDLVGAVVSASPANTVVLFLTDQGSMFGEHRLVGKAVPYEESIRTRAYLALPGDSINVRHDALVAMVDWAPTLLELAGLSVPQDMEGVSLVCILEGTCQDVRTRVSLYQLNQEGGSGKISFSGWRTGPNDPEFPNSVWWSWYPSDRKEGYDLNLDPYQLDNLR